MRAEVDGDSEYAPSFAEELPNLDDIEQENEKGPPEEQPCQDEGSVDIKKLPTDESFGVN